MTGGTFNPFACTLILIVVLIPFIYVLLDCKKQIAKFKNQLEECCVDTAGTRFLNSISVCQEDRKKLGLCTTFKLSDDKADHIYNRIEPDLIKVFGDDYKSYFDLSKNYSRIRFKPQDCLYWAERLIYAKEGLIVDGGLVRVGEDDTLEWNIKMLKVIEAHLVNAHPDAGNDVRYYHAAHMLPITDPVTGKKRRRRQVNKICTNGLFVLGARHVKSARRIWNDTTSGDS